MKILTTTYVWLALFITTPLIAADNITSPLTVSGAVTIDAKQAKKLFDNEVIFIDVRKNKDWEAGRIPGAEHLELKKIFTEKSLNKIIKKNQEVVIYCNGPKCLRSSKATAKAVKWGFTNISYFRSGIPAWIAAKYPVE